MSDLQTFLVKHIIRYLFALKAAADGWVVRYIGGYSLEFEKSLVSSTLEQPLSCSEFVNSYMPWFVDLKIA